MLPRSRTAGFVFLIVAVVIGLGVVAVPPAFAGTVSLNPTSYNFGNQRVGVLAQANLVLTNNGTSTNVTGATITGSSAGDFSQSGCGTPNPVALGPGDACFITVTFQPSSIGPKNVTLTVIQDGGSSATAAISGQGVEPTADLSVTDRAFGAVAVGVPSASQSVTLTNNGTGPLAVGTVGVTGHAGDFSADNGCNGLEVAPSESCSVAVSFTPTAFGARAATLTIPTELGDRTVQLTGSGSDSSAPTATLSNPTVPFALTSSAVLHFSGQDPDSGIDHFQVRRKSAPWNGAFGAWEYPAAWAAVSSTSLSVGLPVGRTSCFAVRSYNAAGLPSPWSVTRCTARPLGDRSLAASRGWTRATGSAYYLGTVTRSSLRGAKLTRTSAKVSRIALVATKCPTCGVVGIYVGSTLIGKVNLARATTANRVLIVLPAFSLRSGTVTIKVLSTRKSVRIEGLGIFRAG